MTQDPPELIIDILTDARKLLEKGWTKGAFARNSETNVVDFNDKAAVCFCLEGAVKRAINDKILTTPELPIGDYTKLLSQSMSLISTEVYEIIEQSSVYYYNDEIADTVDHVTIVLDKAIDTLKKEVQNG